jgi:hypothetical protein
MYFGAERRSQGEVEETSWRHWPDHVRFIFVREYVDILTTS